MNALPVALTVTLLGLATTCTQSDKEILEKTVDKIKSIETIEYEVTTHYLQKDMGMDKTDTAICFFDFTSNDTLIGSKYHFVSRLGEQVFDGKKQFSVDPEKERVLYSLKPGKSNVSSSTFMMNSFYVIKKLLPQFALDPSVNIRRLNDTTINGIENYNFEISIKDRYINIGAELTESEGKTSNYRLFVAKDTYLPTQFKWIFPNGKGHFSSYFSKIKTPAFRQDSAWNLDRLPPEYLKMTYQTFLKRSQAHASVRVGQKAPNWKLPQVFSDSVSLAELTGNLLLVEFWFPYCRGCIKAIPHINEIQSQYLDKGLKVYGIEFTRSNAQGLAEYIRKQKIDYPTLYAGKNIAEGYAVNAAPTFFLIDKKGVIVYSSVGLNKNELINQIEKNL